ncbi:cation-translocating P-type ATPase [Paenibacillus sp. NEAU-GSW1]|uniref:heavy metal translocating P-type ATPase n=1 Tax=Paenibacillus sp. NEAU-GSW1 TaxID=2682486 RepID=UPI0012E19EEF|nr:cation-translocating P-type ATPase [Paenibacillus sp. NEAU-GSW1]MUT67022.1 heavy metal translocating P-type ATPase [Paenibacillus sp. NEAU-GSW1]
MTLLNQTRKDSDVWPVDPGPLSDKMIDFSIQGMSCTACAARIEKAVGKMPGVKQVAVSFPARTAWIQYVPELVQPSQIADKIKHVGFVPSVPEQAQEGLDKERRTLLLRLIVSASLTLPLLAAMIQHLSWLSAISIPPILLNGWLQLGLASIIQFGIGMPFYFGAYQAIRSRSANMDVLVAVGTSAAYLYSHYIVMTAGRSGLSAHELPLYFETSAVVITAVLLGKYIEASATARAQSSSTGFGKLQNSTVTVERAGENLQIKTEFVRPGDYALVGPGETIPVDGVIADGETEIDESLLTGETLPMSKKIGDRVFAGTANGNGHLRIRTEAAGHATMLSRISELVRQAQRSKSDIQRLVDKVSGWFVPAMLLIAAATFMAWFVLIQPGDGEQAFRNGVAVVLVACPCALGLATPISLVIASGRLSKRGIVVKEASALERLAQIDTIMLDKTGTLTEGKPRISKLLAAGGNRNAMLRIAAAVEAQSSHPLAKAIVAEAERLGIVWPQAEHMVYTSGKGVDAIVEERPAGVGNAAWIRQQLRQPLPAFAAAFAEERERAGETVLYVLNDGNVAGALSFTDAIKPYSKQAIARLNEEHIAVLLATGDHQSPALDAAKQAGIGQVYASLLPEDKLELVKKLKAKGRRVAMAGDGWNDAPALAAADVGIAMGDGTEAALNAGHLTLLQPRMTAIPEAVMISRLTVRNVRQNLTFAFIYNALIIPAAACGLLEPWMAGTAMAMSSVSVVGNAIRLNGILRKTAFEPYRQTGKTDGIVTRM